jgi:hypothetical protein
VNALAFQWMTLIGSVILLPLIAIAWRARLMVWQLAALLAFIAAMYTGFYVWLFLLALPREYAWLSAAMRTVEVFAAIGAMLVIIRCNWGKVRKSWTTL